MFFKRIYKTLIGFVTCFIVVVVLMLLLWPTLNSSDYTDLVILNSTYEGNYGAGHFWIILLMLLNPSIFLNFISPVIGTSSLHGMVVIPAFFLILGIWFIGAFAGGLASRGGLRSGLWSALLSYLLLSFLFATISGSIVESSLGSFTVFIINFFAPMVLGSFFVVPILGLAGGIVGGILGKMLFTKSKKKDKETSDNNDVGDN